MSKKIIGVTVGTPLNPSEIKKKMNLESYATEQYVKEYAQPKGDYLTEHQDISGKLDANKLPDAINTALAQAKNSGEFDGKDGKDGKDGVDGQDGYTPQKGIDYFDGKPGKDGADGQSGKDGKDGTSVTVKSVSESTADDGNNVVTFSDGNTLTVKNGTKGKDGTDGTAGKDGSRGTGILKVTTAPSSYTTATGGKNPIKRMSISTIKSQAKVDEVLVGDQICHSYYLYNVYYLDATYAYMDVSQNIRGATGGTGPAGPAGPSFAVQSTPPTDTSVIWVDTSEGTDNEMQELVNAVIASLPVYNGEVV